MRTAEPTTAPPRRCSSSATKSKPACLANIRASRPTDLLNGDLKFTIDFRTVYAGVLEHWLKTKSEPVLGKKFTPLNLV